MNLFFNTFVFFVFCFGICFLLERFYFSLANRYKIIDFPNERSSHAIPVIRGGGIIFIAAIIIGEGLTGFIHPAFLIGALSIAVISFLDDVHPQAAWVRFGCHLAAILLLLYEVEFLDHELWIIVLVTIISVGAVNAFNFMDGINGMTGIYGSINLLTFIYINQFHTPFIPEHLPVAVFASIIVFLIFNFRSKARCFAGDVGSITLAYVQIFFVLSLIVATNNYAWILIFAMYGLDSVITIIHRIWRKENILKPHRAHLYQFLANELMYSHRVVAAGYGFVQLILNLSLLYFIHLEFKLVVIVLSAMGGLLILFRHRVILSIQKIK